MNYLSAAIANIQATPWWAIPAATIAGVLITVAATTTLEFRRSVRDRNARLFDLRRQAYATIADLIRRQMGALNMANSRNPGQDTDFRAPEEVRAIHREAAVQASLVGSPELVEAIDYQYQCTLEAWAAIRKARSELNAMEKYKYTEVEIQKLVDKAEREALRVTNILRKDTGVPGDVLKQWF